MAAPHVAGAAAVLLSERPTWTPVQVAGDLLADATVNVITDAAGSPNRLLFSSPIDPPANDDFVAATPFDLAGPVALAGTNVDATKQVGEPAHGTSPGGTSVWWTFSAPVHGRITLSTEGSTLDTMLAAYSGDALDSLVLLASSNGPGNGSSVVFSVEPGRNYHIAIDGAGGATGSIALGFDWRPATFVPLVPARLLESRSGAGASTVDGLFVGLGVRGAGSVTELVVAGRGGVAVDASAVVLTVTVTEPGAAGFVTVFPCGSSQPLASSLNFVAGCDGGELGGVWCWCGWSGVCVHESVDASGGRCQRVLRGGVVVRAVGAGAVVGVAFWCGGVDGGWVVCGVGCAWCGVGDGVGGCGSWWCGGGCVGGGVDGDGDRAGGCWVRDGVSVWFVAAVGVEFELCGWVRRWRTRWCLVLVWVVGCVCSRVSRRIWWSMSTGSSRRCRRSCRWCRRGCWSRVLVRGRRRWMGCLWGWVCVVRGR